MPHERAIERLVRSLSGSCCAKRRWRRQGVRIACLIDARFGVGPYRWKAKHVEWVIRVQLAEYSVATRYDYWRTIRVLGTEMGRWDGWEPRLRGPWAGSSEAERASKGGRPPKLPGRE